MTVRLYNQDARFVDQLHIHMRKAFAVAQRGDKAKALKIAEAALKKHVDRLIPYVYNSRIKRMIKTPVDLSPKEKEELKQQLVTEKLELFSKILDDL